MIPVLAILLTTLGAMQAAPAVGEVAPAPSASAAEAAEPSDDPAELPVSVERVQRALSRPPALTLRGEKPVFRVEVLGRKMSIEDILGPDYLKGPVPQSGMTHQEFLDMVTPKAYQGYAPFTNREAFAVAATSFALKWALQKAIHRYQSAQQEQEREAARREVQEALMELDKAREKAGLPPR